MSIDDRLRDALSRAARVGTPSVDAWTSIARGVARRAGEDRVRPERAERDAGARIGRKRIDDGTQEPGDRGRHAQRGGDRRDVACGRERRPSLRLGLSDEQAPLVVVRPLDHRYAVELALRESRADRPSVDRGRADRGN